jgi:hypothetical protein
MTVKGQGGSNEPILIFRRPMIEHIKFITEYKGVSKSFENSSIDHQLMAVPECVRCAWELSSTAMFFTI